MSTASAAAAAAQPANDYDFFSAGTTVLLLCLNVFRVTSAHSSYSPDSFPYLRLTQYFFVVATLVHLVSVWLMFWRPAHYNRWRILHTCARWLTVSAMVTTSTPMPVFQASYSTWWLPRLVGATFRCGLMFTLTSPPFYFCLPWRFYAIMSLLYMIMSTHMTRRYCALVMAPYGTSQQQHIDFSTVQGLAAVLDTLSGQGAIHAAGSDASAGQEVQWLPTARALAVTCEPLQVLQKSPAQQEACRAALMGQCLAAVDTLKLGMAYLIVLLLIALEHYSSWQSARCERQRQRQRQGQAAGRSGRRQVSGASSSESLAGAAGQRDSGLAVLLDASKAPTAGALLRIELLKLVVLGDVPVVLVWWALSSVLRQPLGAW